MICRFWNRFIGRFDYFPGR